MRNSFLLVLLLVITGIAPHAYALTVSPVKVEMAGDPGTTIYGEIELFNEQESVRTFFTSFENFEPSGESGTPRFIGGEKGLATWMRTEEEKVTLEPGTYRIVPYSIEIPADAEPGGHFAAIFFSSQAPDTQGGGQVAVSGKVGVLVLLRVSGAIAEGGGLLEFSIKDKQKLFTALPITFIYRVNNTGGDRIVPKGSIKIKNTLRLTSASISANKSDGSVLPNSTRKFEVLWGKKPQTESAGETNQKLVTPPGFFDKAGGELAKFFKKAGEQWSEFHFGWYTAKLHIAWGTTNQTADAEYNFFVLPWQILIIALIVLWIVLFLGKKMIKKYNRWIIAQALEQNKNGSR